MNVVLCYFIRDQKNYLQREQLGKIQVENIYLINILSIINGSQSWKAFIDVMIMWTKAFTKGNTCLWMENCCRKKRGISWNVSGVGDSLDKYSKYHAGTSTQHSNKNGNQRAGEHRQGLAGDTQREKMCKGNLFQTLKSQKGEDQIPTIGILQIYVRSDEHHTKGMLFSVTPDSTLCLQITFQEDSIRDMRQFFQMLLEFTWEIYMPDNKMWLLN